MIDQKYINRFQKKLRWYTMIIITRNKKALMLNPTFIRDVLDDRWKAYNSFAVNSLLMRYLLNYELAIVIFFYPDPTYWWQINYDHCWRYYTILSIRLHSCRLDLFLLTLPSDEALRSIKFQLTNSVTSILLKMSCVTIMQVYVTVLC